MIIMILFLLLPMVMVMMMPDGSADGDNHEAALSCGWCHGLAFLLSSLCCKPCCCSKNLSNVDLTGPG